MFSLSPGQRSVNNFKHFPDSAQLAMQPPHFCLGKRWLAGGRTIPNNRPKLFGDQKHIYTSFYMLICGIVEDSTNRQRNVACKMQVLLYSKVDISQNSIEMKICMCIFNVDMHIHIYIQCIYIIISYRYIYIYIIYIIYYISYIYIYIYIYIYADIQ